MTDQLAPPLEHPHAADQTGHATEEGREIGGRCFAGIRSGFARVLLVMDFLKVVQSR